MTLIISGCSSSGGVKTGKVNPKSEKTIGNVKRDGVEITIPKGTFENSVKVSIEQVDDSTITLDDDVTFLNDPIQLFSDGGEHTLGETVTIKMKLPKSMAQDDYLMIMGAYYDEGQWTYILPDFDALEKGYLEFGTPHFSIFAPVKLSKEKALEQYSNTLAVQNVTGKPQTQEDLNLYEEMNQYFSDTLESMGFTDKTAQGVILQKLAEENVVGAIVGDIKNGNVADVAGHAAEHIAKAIIKSSDIKKFKDSLPNAAGGAVSGAVAAAIELYETGDYAAAYKEFVYSASGFVPGMNIAKAVVEATKAGIDMWQDYSIEYAYKGVYLAQTLAPDGSITEDSWVMVFHNMGSGLTSLKQQYRALYAAANGKTLKEIDKDKALKERLDEAVENDIKRNFKNRYTRSTTVEAEQQEIMKILSLFNEYGLLDPDTLLSYPHSMSLTDRLDSLMKIRQSILDLVKDRSVFGNTDKKIEDNLAFAVKMWLLHGKDRAQFYDWMRTQGYLKKPSVVEGGHWERIATHHKTKHFNQELEGNKDWSYKVSGSEGTGTFIITYLGPSQEDDYEPRPKNGENGTITGSVSTPPSRIYAGETVTLKMNVSVSSTKQHFFDWSGDATAWFDQSGIEIGYGTGAAINFLEKKEERDTYRILAWIYAPTNWRSKEYGNKPSVSSTASAVAPKGYTEGDEISLYTQVSTPGLSSRTEYVYIWHE